MSPDPPAVLVVGDANADLVLRGDVVPRFGQVEQLLDSAELTLGGSAAIVAAGLAALATPVALAARIGDDAFGRLTLDHLARRGVELSRVEVDATIPTGLSLILSAGDDRAILTLPGTIPTLRANTVDEAALRGVSHVHVASYFLQPDLAAGLPGLLGRARAAGCTTSLDTNWDPRGGWKGVADLLPMLDLLLPNTAELLALTGGALDERSGQTAESRARTLQRSGPVVAVKAGAEGGWVVGDHGVTRVAPPAVEAVDTTGGGDSFDAGFLAGWVRGLPPPECLRWAVAAGSLSTRASGGTAAQPSAAELRAVLG